MAKDLAKYHVVFEDPASSEQLGLILDERSGSVGRVARLANPYAAKIGGGDRTLSDLTDLSAYGQTDWHGGRAQDRWDEDDRFLDSVGVETRIKGQVTLGPLAVLTAPAGSSARYYLPTDVKAVAGPTWTEGYTAYAQQFQTPAAGMTCTHVVVRLRANRAVPHEEENGLPIETGRSCRVELWSDSGGNLPGTMLRSKFVYLYDTYWKDMVAVWDTSIALTGSTAYWIVVGDVNQVVSYDWQWEWAADKSALYTGGVAAIYDIDITTWLADATRDYWFMVNDGPVLAGAVTVNPVRYSGGIYAAAGDTVYKWNTGTKVWDVSEQRASETVTDMIAVDGKLWVARGANNVRVWNGSTWADAAGPIQAQLFLVYGGYLYRSDPTTLDQFYYTSDGTTWQGPVTVGMGDWGITGMAGFRDEVALATSVGLWLQAADWTYQVLDWASQESAPNGVGVVPWSSVNELFIPISHGLYRWTGATMVAMGPDTGAGLPSDRIGSIAALCGTVNWLFAAVDAGDEGCSSIMLYGGRNWHELYRARQVGRRVQALTYETLSDPPRLWFGEGSAVRYIELPDYTDNPYQFAGFAYDADGEVDLSSWGSELMPVLKDWRYVIVQSEATATDQPITLYYEIDRSGLWAPVGTVQGGKVLERLAFPAPTWSTKTTIAGSTTTELKVTTAQAYDVTPGSWCRVSGEHRQVKRIEDNNSTIVLALPLSTAPASGVSIYPSSPVGGEIRLRAHLETTLASNSPKLLGLACYCDANVLDRWQLTLDVRVDDDLKCLDGSPYPMDAAALEAALQTWIARQAPFTVHDLRGTQHTVKVANAVEGTPRRSKKAPWTYTSVMHIGLIETEVASL